MDQARPVNEPPTTELNTEYYPPSLAVTLLSATQEHKPPLEAGFTSILRTLFAKRRKSGGINQLSSLESLSSRSSPENPRVFLLPPLTFINDCRRGWV